MRSRLVFNEQNCGIYIKGVDLLSKVHGLCKPFSVFLVMSVLVLSKGKFSKAGIQRQSVLGSREEPKKPETRK